jgi:hypothetical protein
LPSSNLPYFEVGAGHDTAKSNASSADSYFKSTAYESSLSGLLSHFCPFNVLNRRGVCSGSIIFERNEESRM